eukprot:CAMPEP_0172527008 /NCGR_PEP_ID=MMETSP1067-20121228/1811_1 /TAXON_ID=265564 ORGANISM="Thalassiosira punctigera, Strain Tpunct2005C2" /NCGR_SAMPLE_ID=MMETSP1067 /ASSEMBLY_ACC=CAM_ASM_000444 /LENGTH=158 /DNA_ID=CAMNT_0013310663 /DNA_START=96 /DNA_END=572 /DNA_ORIENTATION=-
MKLSSIFAIAASVSSASAFMLSSCGTPSATVLKAVSGDVVRDERGTYAAHGTGEIGSFDRSPPGAGSPVPAVMGEDVRHARPTYAAQGTGEIGSFDRSPPRGGAPVPAVMGEDVRHSRPTYAAQGAGEIGSTERKAFVPQSLVLSADEPADEEGIWKT